MWQLRGPRVPLLRERKGEREMERETKEEFTLPTMNWPQKSHSTISATFHFLRHSFVNTYPDTGRIKNRLQPWMKQILKEHAGLKIQYCYGHFWKISSTYHKVLSVFLNKGYFSFKRWFLSAGCHNSTCLGHLSFPLDHQSLKMTLGPCTVSYSIRVTLAAH